MQAMATPTYSIGAFAFDTAMQGFRAERRQQTLVLRSPDTGAFLKSGVMLRAHQLAKRLTPSCGLSYRERVQLSMRNAWAEARAAGKPYSSSQVDRRWSKQRLVQSARAASRLEA